LLVLQFLTVRQEDFERHFRRVEVDFFTLARVDEARAESFVADFEDEVTHQVIVDTGAKRAEEVNGLTFERIDEDFDVFLLDAIRHEDTVGDADTIFTSREPIELIHTAITNKQHIKNKKIITNNNNQHTQNFNNFILTQQLNVRGVIRDVHKHRVHHLIINGVLRHTTHTTNTNIKIVDEEGKHTTLLDDIKHFAVTLTHELDRFTGVAGFKLTGKHNDRKNTELLKDQIRLKSLTLTLTTPDTENDRHLDLRQLHEVLRDVHDHLVHVRRGDVEVLRGDVVVRRVRLHARGQVILRGHDGVVRTTDSGRALELGVNHVAAASDVLLVVGNVHVHALPSAHLNLGTVRHGGDARAEEGLRRDGALRRGVRLDAASRLRDRGHRARVSRA